jgi:hypothetical protein
MPTPLYLVSFRVAAGQPLTVRLSLISGHRTRSDDDHARLLYKSRWHGKIAVS